MPLITHELIRPHDTLHRCHSNTVDTKVTMLWICFCVYNSLLQKYTVFYLQIFLESIYSSLLVLDLLLVPAIRKVQIVHVVLGYHRCQGDQGLLGYRLGLDLRAIPGVLKNGTRQVFKPIVSKGASLFWTHENCAFLYFQILAEYHEISILPKQDIIGKDISRGAEWCKFQLHSSFQ